MKKNFWFLNPIFGFVLLLVILTGLICADIYKKHNQIQPIVVKEVIKEKEAYSDKEIVVFNLKSKKFHKNYCEWAKKCKRCIRIPKNEAVKMGGIPCKICGKIR